MQLGSRSFYALIRGGRYMFDSKRHRDSAVELLGGEVVYSREVYDDRSKPNLGAYKPVYYWRFKQWLADMLQEVSAND